MREAELPQCQIRGWRAVSANELQGKDSYKRSFCFTDTGRACYATFKPTLSHFKVTLSDPSFPLWGTVIASFIIHLFFPPDGRELFLICYG